jgi:hypothetical protein
MPKKLTKDQKYYRKKKKEAQNDYKRVPREGKTPSIRVARKPLCVRVSAEAAERLKQLATDVGLHQWEMATRIIHNGIAGGIAARGYASYNYDTQKFEWNEERLNPPESISYKGSTGDKQLNLSIHSTAWNKLACYSNELEQSKARVFQRLVLDYKPVSKEKLAKQEQRRKEQQEYYRQWNLGINRTPSQPTLKPKFFVDNYEVIHVKGIPVEMWDDAEWEEYERLQADVSQRMQEKLNGD